MAAPGDSFADLRDTLASCTGTTAEPTTVVLSTDIGDPAGELDIACVAVIDLAGHDLDAATIRIAAGQQLTIDDSAEVDGTLTVNAGALMAGIRTTDATLIVVDGTLDVTGGNFAAGIGGDSTEAGGTVRIEGGTVTASNRPWGGAAIGGGNGGAGGDITITGGTVTASTEDRGAGIGGGAGGSAGTVTITGGTVTASTEYRGAGIGGGSGGAGGDITITGGTVTATSGERAAAIGGGSGGAGGDITISGGTVTAVGSARGNGIGGGPGAGAAVTISGGQVTATAPYGIGIASDATTGTVITGGTVQVSAQSGIAGPTPSPLTLAGTAEVAITADYPLSTWAGDSGQTVLEDSAHLTLDGGEVIIPAGEPRGIDVRDDAVLAGDPTLTGSGSIGNDNIILIDASLVQVPVVGNHFRITFETPSGVPEPDPVVIFAPTLQQSQQSLPAGMDRDTDQFVGWLLGGDVLTEQTTLPGTSIDGDPVQLEATPAWSPTSLATGLPEDAATIAAGETVTFTPTVLDADGAPLASDPSTWTLTGDADLTVDTSTGEITATSVTVGVIPLTLTVPYGAGEHTAQIDLTVEAGPTAAIELTASEDAVDQGDSVTITATGADAYGNSTGDVTDEVTLSSDVASDVIGGNQVTFPHASPHTITGTHTGGATATVLVEVAPATEEPPTTPEPQPTTEPADEQPAEPSAGPQPAGPSAGPQLAQTGTGSSVPGAVAALTLLLTGIATVLLTRSRRTR